MKLYHVETNGNTEKILRDQKGKTHLSCWDRYPYAYIYMQTVKPFKHPILEVTTKGDKLPRKCRGRLWWVVPNEEIISVREITDEQFWNERNAEVGKGK